MEIEYFIRPPKKEKDWREIFEKWQGDIKKFFREDLGIAEKNMRWRRHDDNERSFYSKDTYDVEYDYPGLGWGELHGFAYRTDYDLKQHIKYSGADLYYRDENGEKFIPHCIEPSFGLTRTVLAVLIEFYSEEEIKTIGGEKETRVVMKFPVTLAPVKIAILPLSKKEELISVSREIFSRLKENYMVEHHLSGSIGKRYRRQDEIGTPFCVTVDFETLNDQAVTVRDRDTMKQERIEIAKLEEYFKEKLKN
jgi:glycyl-tRNA synthetase